MCRAFYIRLVAILIAAILNATVSSAGTSDRVRFEIKPRVVSQLIDQVQGETRLLVASNAAFSIRAKGMIGTVTVTVEQSGDIDGTQFGSASQLPGQANQETFLVSRFETPIYTANRKTAYRPGAPIDQAVLILVTYTGPTHPTLIIAPKI